MAVEVDNNVGDLVPKHHLQHGCPECPLQGNGKYLAYAGGVIESGLWWYDDIEKLKGLWVQFGGVYIFESNGLSRLELRALFPDPPYPQGAILKYLKENYRLVWES